MLRKTLALLLLSQSVMAANIDGNIDTNYGNSGRLLFGYLESSTLELQAITKSSSGRVWMFADDVNDRGALYVARSLASGQPDTGFGPNADGRRRTLIPASLITQTEAIAISGASVQSYGKPLIFGGLRHTNGETGAFPGVVCRLAAAGNFDATFGTAGCRTLRTFLIADESCVVSDVAIAPNDAFVVVGNCSGPSAAERPFLARLTSAGALDTEFGAGAGLLTPLIPQAQAIGQHYWAVVVRPGGQSVVLGHFVTSNAGEPDQDLGVLQFDSDGGLDSSFSGDGVALLRYSLAGDRADFARDLVLRPDGRALALGQTTTTTPAPAHVLALYSQLLPNGSNDNSFGANGTIIDTFGQSLSAGSTLRALDVDASGRPVLAGARSAAPAAALTRPGTDFWLAIPRSVPPEVDPRILISSASATSGLIVNAELGISIPFTVTPGQLTTVVVPHAIVMTGPPDSTALRALHLTAQDPVTVNTVIGRQFSFDGYAALPTAMLGTQYRIMSWGQGLGAGGAITVAATRSATVITVTPSVTVGSRPAGVAYQVALDQGEVYGLSIFSGPALSGSTVSANKPVVVYGSHSCGQVPNATFDFCEMLVEQMLPTDSFGQEFLTVPFANRSAGDIIRVYAHQSSTGISVNGTLSAILTAGSFYETSRTAATRITSTQPVSVAQFAKSCRVEAHPDNCYGDPTMLTVLPTSQWVSRYNAVVPQMVGVHDHFLQIVAPVSAINDVRIDGQSVAAASFAAIPGGTHVAARVPTTPGTHHVIAPQPIAVSVYGFRDNAEAYSFPAVAAAAGEGANSDDLIVRYQPNGTRDSLFGDGGVALFDHSAAYGTALPAFDSACRALVDGGGILVGTASINPLTHQSFMLSYRIEGGALFRDGFE